MTKLQFQWNRLKLALVVWRHFEHFWLLVLLRLGIVKVPYFVYQIHKEGRRYSMIGRPTASASGDIFVLREVLADETYKDALALVQARDIRIVDIGANLGSFTIWANRVAGLREAFCFEPEPESLRLLNFNLYINGCFQARPIECAVGGKERTIRIAMDRRSPAGANIYDSRAEGRAVPVISFEKWLRETDGNFDLLKMDCEGAEWEIVRLTSPQQFARFRVVVVEVHPDPEKKQDTPEFKPMMEKLGFRTVRWDNKCNGIYVGIRDTA